MKLGHWAGLIGFGLLAVAGSAAPLERDLGQGLVYVRARELPGDLPAQPAGVVPPCVLDLRYVAAGREVAAAFSAWLKFRASTRTPVFVLANRETSPELRRALGEPHRGTGIAVIGIAGHDFVPDVPVRATPESERAAYDALDQGTPLAALLTDNPDKARNDEARLLQAPVPAPKAETPPAATIDATLQRAVHFHRALGALRRVP